MNHRKSKIKNIKNIKNKNAWKYQNMQLRKNENIKI